MDSTTEFDKRQTSGVVAIFESKTTKEYKSTTALRSCFPASTAFAFLCQVAPENEVFRRVFVPASDVFFVVPKIAPPPPNLCSPVSDTIALIYIVELFCLAATYLLLRRGLLFLIWWMLEVANYKQIAFDSRRRHFVLSWTWFGGRRRSSSWGHKTRIICVHIRRTEPDSAEKRYHICIFDREIYVLYFPLYWLKIWRRPTSQTATN